MKDITLHLLKYSSKNNHYASFSKYIHSYT
jgi:hypothetical protein